MQKSFKVKLLTILLVSTVLSTNHLKSSNSKLSSALSYLRKAYTIPTRLLKPSTGIIPSSKDKVSQLSKIAKYSKSNITDISEETKCLETFSNSINGIAVSLKETSTFSKFIEKLSDGISDIYNKVAKNETTNREPKLNIISDIYNKVAKNGITNRVECDTIKEVVNQEGKAYISFNECVENIPNEQLSVISKTIKGMSPDVYSDLIKIRFENIKFLFQNFLETVAPKNDFMQSTITWIIVLVGVPATTYGIYRLVKMIKKIIPVISRFSLYFVKKMIYKYHKSVNIK